MIDQVRIGELRAAAWADYLEVARDAHEESRQRYEALEPLAWELLQENLARLDQLEHALEKASGGQAGHVPAR